MRPLSSSRVVKILRFCQGRHHDGCTAQPAVQHPGRRVRGQVRISQYSAELVLIGKAAVLAPRAIAQSRIFTACDGPGIPFSGSYGSSFEYCFITAGGSSCRKQRPPFSKSIYQHPAVPARRPPEPMSLVLGVPMNAKGHSLWDGDCCRRIILQRQEKPGSFSRPLLRQIRSTQRNAIALRYGKGSWRMRQTRPGGRHRGT